MSDIITTYHHKAPVFLPFYPKTIETRKAAFENLVNEEGVIVILAEKDNNIIGYQDYEPISKSLMNPDKSIELSVAGTLMEHMGKGVGKKLMNEAVKILKDNGYQYIVSDWKIANLASSIFLPKCGFKATAYRVTRTIDINYA